ncbi:hypothetical protein BAE44_0004991 [Dichanthelium oligosanthes]|uniref:Myb/SANT-like domain-containing protein n=1 Tax=Dichanthelium oligosanthes TaxID=888268 RepID=A0A1E5W9R5_9POAL|nr:hypothetical protein BAE44_0004991 [Dichanthelium oligosanthes]
MLSATDCIIELCDANIRIVCELFIEQVQAQNRFGTHLNRQGYANVIATFQAKTGLSYTKAQFKNKWDKMGERIQQLETIAKRDRQYKDITKFEHRKLENEEQLDIMFEDLRNTGDDHWAPSSGDLPKANEAHHEEDIDKEVDHEEDDPSDVEDGTPTSGKATKRRCVAEKDKGKKPKSAGGHWMQEQRAKIVELNEKTTTSCESIVLTRMEKSSIYSIKIMMDLVKAWVQFLE